MNIVSELNRVAQILVNADDFDTEDSEYLLHGKCHEWAIHNYRPGDKFFVVTEYDDDLDGYALVHCGLYRDGKYIDVRGEFDSLDDVLDDFDCDYDADNEILTKSEFLRFCKDFNLDLDNTDCV